MEVKTEACERLLAQRIEAKLKSKKANEIVDRLHVAVPTPRDDKVRPAFIPDNVIQRKKGNAMKVERKLQKEYEEEDEDYKFDDNALYMVKDNEKYDIIPEIIDGKNIADYIDPDIFEKLEQLEQEEQLREAAGVYDSDIDDMDSEEEEIHRQAQEIRKKKNIRVQEHRQKKGHNNNPNLPRKASIKVEEFNKAGKKRKRANTEMDIDDGEDDMDVDMEVPRRSRSVVKKAIKKKKMEAVEARSKSKGHTRSLTRPRDQSVIDPEQKVKVKKIAKLGQRKMNMFGRAGESDRHIHMKKPKHLFSGKRGKGKTDRR